MTLSRSKRELTQADFELMELPKGFWNVKWSDFTKVPGLEGLQRYLKRIHAAIEDGDGVLIFGPQLSGKSHLSAYIARLVRSYNGSVHWCSAIDIQDRIYRRDTYQDIDADVSILERYRKVDLLVIDNLGSEILASRGGRNHVTELIEYRIAWNKPMVINTYRAEAEMNAIYHDGYFNWLMSLHFPVMLVDTIPKDFIMSKYARE